VEVKGVKTWFAKKISRERSWKMLKRHKTGKESR
jgi:hypothetical protein